MTRPRIFFLAWTVPGPNGGACLALHRHFLLHDDFELFVASSSAFHNERIPSLRLTRHPIMARAASTRFARWVRQFEMLIEPRWAVRQAEPVCRRFQPDCLFTVPDNTLSWTAGLLARRAGVPLITNFQDWWPRGQFTLRWEKPIPPTRFILERRLRRLYRDSALAFCTSEGMREFLGPHPNARLLYPTAAPRDPAFQPEFNPPAAGQPLRLVYAGTIIAQYGRAVLELARVLRGRPDVRFEVYGPRPDWPASDRAWMEEEGVYRGLVSQEVLRGHLRNADAFLTVMSFEPAFEVMMRTSFTTKFLEYCQYAKPVVVWGPEYCQPVQVARRENAGLVVTTPEPAAVATALAALREPETWRRLAQGSWRAATGIFDHENLHAGFKQAIGELLAPAKARAAAA